MLWGANSISQARTYLSVFSLALRLKEKVAIMIRFIAGEEPNWTDRKFKIGRRFYPFLGGVCCAINFRCSAIDRAATNPNPNQPIAHTSSLSLFLFLSLSPTLLDRCVIDTWLRQKVDGWLIGAGGRRDQPFFSMLNKRRRQR